MLKIRIAFMAFTCDIHDQERYFSFAIIWQILRHVDVPAELADLNDVIELGFLLQKNIWPQGDIYHQVDNLRQAHVCVTDSMVSLLGTKRKEMQAKIHKQMQWILTNRMRKAFG